MRVAHLVMGRADDGGVVGLPSHARQVLAHLKAGPGRADRPKDNETKPQRSRNVTGIPIPW